MKSIIHLLLLVHIAPVLLVANVTYVGRDTSTQGTWRSLSAANTKAYDIDNDGQYGSLGYLIFNCSTNMGSGSWGWAGNMADPFNAKDLVYNNVLHTTVRTGFSFLTLNKAELSNYNVEPWGRVSNFNDPRTDGGNMYPHWAAVDGKRAGKALTFTFTKGYPGTLRFGFILPGNGKGRVNTIEIHNAAGEALASSTTNTDGGELNYYFFDFSNTPVNTAYTLYLARPAVSGDENNIKILGFTLDKKYTASLLLLR